MIRRQLWIFLGALWGVVSYYPRQALKWVWKKTHFSDWMFWILLALAMYVAAYVLDCGTWL